MLNNDHAAQSLKSLTMRVEIENERSHYKIESRLREGDESLT